MSTPLSIIAVGKHCSSTDSIAGTAVEAPGDAPSSPGDGAVVGGDDGGTELQRAAAPVLGITCTRWPR